jgi:hypothetical protein
VPDPNGMHPETIQDRGRNHDITKKPNRELGKSNPSQMDSSPVPSLKGLRYQLFQLAIEHAGNIPDLGVAELAE